MLNNLTKNFKGSEIFAYVFVDLAILIILLDACTNMIAVNTELLAIEGGRVFLPNVT